MGLSAVPTNKNISNWVHDMVLDISYFYHRGDAECKQPKITFSHQYWCACRGVIGDEFEGKKLILHNGFEIYYDESLRKSEFTVEKNV